VRGFRIELGEIETALAQCGGVQEAVVMVRDDLPGGRGLVGFVEPADLDVAELRSSLKERLPEYMVPSTIVLLESLPRTPNGKLDRQALGRRPVLERGHRGDFVAPRPGVEELIAGIWSEVLEVGQVGREDNFFDHGGHSLLATQVVSRIAKVLGVELPLRVLFEEPTVAGLAAALEEARRSDREVTAPPIRPFPREGSLPLSFAQERMWFIDQLQPGSSMYLMPSTLFLPGTLRPEVLGRVLAEVIRRHEALRTSFQAIDGLPVQLIAPPAGWSVPQVDLSALPGPARDREARQLAAAEADRPFDLARGPLLRTTLLRLGGENVLLLNMHHIVSDDWSLRVLEWEVEVLYEAFARGAEPPLPELPIQYADFAQWQREWLSGPELERQLGFWRSHLAGAPAALELPTDRPRSTVQNHRGSARSLALGPELSAGLKVLGRQERATLFMVVLGSFATLLSRFSSQEDVVVGTPIANRNRAEIEGLIGFFVNTLVLRTNLAGDPGFQELLGRVRQVTLDAYAHQDLPFERLVSELQVERSLFYTPLFQVLLTAQNTRVGGASRAEPLRDPAEGSDERAAKFDLMLGVEEGGESLVVSCAFNRDLFDGVTIERLLRSYEQLLGAIVASPGQRVREIPLLGEAERHQLGTEWNDTARAEPAGDACLHQLFERQVERTPSAVALVFGEERWSYAELNRKANQVAHRLRRLGVGPEVRVGVLLERSPEMVAGLLGILKAGGAYVPLDPAYPADRLAFMIEDAGAGILLVDQRFSGAVAPGLRLLRLGAEGEATAGGPEENLPPLASPDNLAYLIYTSGSTGRAKGVAIEHRSGVALMAWAGEVFSPEELRGVLASTSISFDLSVFELFLPLGRGGTVVLAQSALALPSLPAFGEVTLINTVPSAMAALAGGALPPRLRTVNLAGEVLEAGLAERIHAHPQVERVINLYGPSEDTTYSTFAVVGRGDARIPIGRPVAGSGAYVVDARGELAPLGVAGELCLSGAGLTRGYLDRPELTAERFVPDPFGGRPGERMYRTGDRCRRLADGGIEFLGRLDQQIKLRGFRIELGEIETVLSQQPGVEDAAVVVREDLPGGRGLVAYVAPADRSAAELRSSLKSRLPEYMVPPVFVALDALPRMPNGKVDRRALAQRPVLDRGDDVSLSPRTVVEELIEGIWSEVLGVERVGVESNFFDLGGHSLLATQVVSRIRQVFAADLPLRSLFQEPTVAGLARIVEQTGRSARELILPPILPVPREGALPLSFGQERLWFLDQLEPGPLYNMPLSMRLQAGLEPAVLERVLGEVVRRHEALRTTFRAVNGQPEQVIAPPAAWSLPRVDLSALSAPLLEGEALRLAAEDAVRPFDLSRGPLLRTTLLWAGSELILLVNMHHIVSDGWSMGVLELEVTRLYEAFSRGEASPLPELPVQYADFAIWQRAWLSGAELERQAGFWREHLAGIPPVLNLPLDRPRPTPQSYRGALRSLGLSPGLSAGLRALARQQRATLFMVLLGSFSALLSRYAAQDDVVVGSPIANRNRAEIESLIGFFVNTLALRTDLSREPSFGELLGRVRQVALEAYAHQDLPFERLVEELQMERSLSHSPVFQVMLVLQNAPGGRLPDAGRAGEIERFEEGLAKFDLTQMVQETGPGLRLGLEYSRDLFDGVTIERLLRAYERLLGAIVASPGQRIRELPLLGEAEQHQVLVEWNDTSAPNRPVCLHEFFRAQAERTPDAVAASFGEEEWTYAELGERAGRLARRLRGLGVGPEVVVGVCLERSLDLLVALLGVLEAGGAYLPLAPEYPAERLAWMIEDARPAALLAGSGLLPDLPPGAPPVLDPAGLGKEPAPASETGAPRVDLANLAYVIFTSGSTGRPKGVMVSHGAIANHVLWMQQRFPLRADDRVLQKTPFSFDASVWELFQPLACGARVVLAQPGGHQDSAYLVDAVQRHEVTVLQLVPSMLRVFLEEKGVERCTSLRWVFAGGEALPGEVRERFQDRLEAGLFNLYGPTEASIDSSFWECGHDGRPVSTPIGRPLDNLRLFLLDGAFRPVPIGAPGELCISGAGLSRGYAGRPDLTAERFLPDPWSAEPGARLYRTGDLARHGADGVLEFLGRSDNQIKIRGFRIEPGEVEAALAGHPDVREAAVVVWENPLGDARLVAYVVPPDGSGQLVAELRETLRRRLPDSMVPAAFVALERLPRAPSGKIDRRALSRRPVEAVHDGRVRVDPRDTTELELARIWEELLGAGRVGVTDDFFELGGHSLLAVRLFARIEASFGRRLPLALLFQARTVERLAAALRGNRRSGAQESPALVAIQPAGDQPPFFCVHAVGGSVLSYASLAHHLGPDQPFYGLQAQGIDDVLPPADGIEEMASCYLEALRTVQPSGPYRLGGWSMGGLVAYEMARQLLARGEEVALLAMIDTPVPEPSPGPESDLDRLAGFALDLGLPLERLGASRDELAGRGREQLLSDLLEWGRASRRLPPDLGEPHLRRLLAVYEANLRAATLYRPGPYDGRIVLFKAAEPSGGDFDWERFAAGGVEVRNVSGGHYSLMRESGVQELAAGLAAALARARS
jgi:amino acid adenylation domain-containing protein